MSLYESTLLFYVTLCQGLLALTEPIHDGITRDTTTKEEGMILKRTKKSSGDLPETLNWKDKGMFGSLKMQGGCNVCGYVSGVQTLESRVAITTENYHEWSIQNFLTCLNIPRSGSVCTGAQPMRVAKSVSINFGLIVPETINPFVRAKCMQNNTCMCITPRDSSANSKLRFEQWFFIGKPDNSVKSAEELEIALQSGPVTTCFDRYKKSGPGNRCRPGCSHANSIIGYDKDRWYLQESLKIPYLRDEIPGLVLEDGVWAVNRGSECAEAIIRKARYPTVFFDYDQGNAYYVEDIVKETDIKHEVLKDVGLENKGLAKNRCSMMGAMCKGVAVLSSGAVTLVTQYNVKEEGSTSQEGTIPVFWKRQMVVYLKDHASGMYLSAKKKQKLKLTPSTKHRSPFFFSGSRIISFERPEYLLGPKGMLEDHDYMKPNPATYWILQDANLRSSKSGMSLTVKEDTGELTAQPYNPQLPSQRFNLGLSGKFKLRYKPTGVALKQNHYRLSFNGNGEEAYLRWQARQILDPMGHPFTESWSPSPDIFKMEAIQNQVIPTDVLLRRLLGLEHLTIKKNLKVTMNTEKAARWTLEYGEI